MCLTYIFICLGMYVQLVYMTIVHSTTIAGILSQLPATSNPKTVRGMCYVILGMIGLTSCHDTNYK